MKFITANNRPDAYSQVSKRTLKKILLMKFITANNRPDAYSSSVINALNIFTRDVVQLTLLREAIKASV